MEISWLTYTSNNATTLKKPTPCCFLRLVRFCIPAGGAVARDYLTQASVQTVVWLHLAGALTRQTVHGAVARVAQTLGLLCPSVHHAAGKLVARQEFTGICLVG